jgi:hypothetical protein
VRADLRQPSLGRVAEAVVDRARDRELEDAVPEEFEALVRRGALVRPGGVREYLVEALRRELSDQAAELFRPIRESAGSLAATAGAR